MVPERVEGDEYLPPSLPDTQQPGDPSQQQGTNVPKPGLEQRSGDIYQRRTRYDDAYLQENLEPLSQRFNAALRNPADPLNHAAKQGLHVFAETMAQREGISLSEAAREHHLPLGSLSEWARQRLVPTLYKDSHAVYIAKEAALKTAAAYRKAKEARTQPARLLKGIFKK
jgi:hypothetical protein